MSESITLGPTSTQYLKGGEMVEGTILSADIVPNPFEEGQTQIVVTFEVEGSDRPLTDFISPTLNVGPNGPSRLRALTNAVLGQPADADPGINTYPDVLTLGTKVRILTRAKVTKQGASIVVPDRYLAA